MTETKQDVFNAAVEKAVGMTLVAGYTSYGEKYRKDMQKRYADATDGETEAQTKCKYCHKFDTSWYYNADFEGTLGNIAVADGKTIAEGAYSRARMAITKKRVIGILAEGDDSGFGVINYCPMCGRKLGGEQ